MTKLLTFGLQWILVAVICRKSLTNCRSKIKLSGADATWQLEDKAYNFLYTSYETYWRNTCHVWTSELWKVGISWPTSDFYWFFLKNCHIHLRITTVSRCKVCSVFRMKSEAYPGPSETPKMENFAAIVNGSKLQLRYFRLSQIRFLKYVCGSL